MVISIGNAVLSILEEFYSSETVFRGSQQAIQERTKKQLENLVSEKPFAF